MPPLSVYACKFGEVEAAAITVTVAAIIITAAAANPAAETGISALSTPKNSFGFQLFPCIFKIRFAAGKRKADDLFRAGFAFVGEKQR